MTPFNFIHHNAVISVIRVRENFFFVEFLLLQNGSGCPRNSILRQIFEKHIFRFFCSQQKSNLLFFYPDVFICVFFIKTTKEKVSFHFLVLVGCSFLSFRFSCNWSGCFSQALFNKRIIFFYSKKQTDSSDSDTLNAYFILTR